MKEATWIFGAPIDPGTGKPIEVDEHEHLYACAECGQAVDMRGLGQVFHHEEAGHAPLDLDA